jgi:hypothetical protein
MKKLLVTFGVISSIALYQETAQSWTADRPGTVPNCKDGTLLTWKMIIVNA